MRTASISINQRGPKAGLIPACLVAVLCSPQCTVVAADETPALRGGQELRTTAIQSPDGSQSVIRFQARYSDPTAAEVRLVWGLDKFTRVPDRLPAGTTLAFGNSHLMTTMRRDGDVFLAEQEVAPDTQLDYTFEVTRLVTGEPVSIWRGPSSDGGDFSRKLTVENADERIIDHPKRTASRHALSRYPGQQIIAKESVWTTLPSAPAGRDADEAAEVLVDALPAHTNSRRDPADVRVHVRFRSSIAEDVMLNWGVNEYRSIPGKLPEGTVLTRNNTHLNTPMKREGNWFVADLDLSPGTRLHYAFTIIRTSAGEAARIWRPDPKSGADYTTIIKVAEPATAADVPQPSLLGDKKWPQLLGLSVLVLLWVGFELRRGRRRAPLRGQT